MEFNIQPGIKGEYELTVEYNHTADALGSGGVKVFATPMMVAIMEGAALRAAAKHLPEGYSTVGTNLNVSHIAATPVGMKVRAEAELIKVEGKRLTFKVEAYDETEKIGEGTHERYIIELSRFLQKASQKGNI